jgi:hypothetical protein
MQYFSTSMKEADHHYERPPFWDHDQAIGRFHTQGETYDLYLRSRTLAGPATKPSYFLGQAYIVEPRPQLPAPVRRVLGASGDPRALDRVRVGDVQALYAPLQQRIEILSCLLLPHYQEAEPKRDANFRGLWHGAEEVLEAQFPAARVLTTSVQDRHYQRADYVAFLHSLGYLPAHPSLRSFVRPL